MTPEEIAKAALNEGIEVPIKTRKGEDRAVFLRLIRISEVERFLELSAGHERKALEFCLPDGFDTDTLADSSYDALLEANIELNFTRARDRIAAQLSRAEKSGVGLQEAMQVASRLLLGFVQPPKHSPAEASPKS